jgi:hypothetical protein
VIYLLVYDRANGILRSESTFRDAELSQANSARLNAELANANSPDVEVVILQAESKKKLRETHARYFKTVRELRDTA